jgi:DNA-binding IclR family transcriptional regulator
MTSSKDNNIQSVERALVILEELAKNGEGSRITSLVINTGMAKSTIHRILMTLINKGYVEKSIDSENYKLSTKILSLGNTVLSRMDIRKIAKPYIEKLSKKTGEVVHLGIIDDGEVVYIDKVENPTSSIRMFSQIGKRGPTYCTGIGKVLLAYLTDEDVEVMLGNKEMIKFTNTTITTIDLLKKELKTIRENGYGFDEMEHENEIRCVAAPIYGRSRKVIAAISITGPVIYVTKKRMPELIKDILNIASTISYQMGYESKS